VATPHGSDSTLNEARPPMSSTVASILRTAGLETHGSVPWGTVSLSADVEAIEVTRENRADFVNRSSLRTQRESNIQPAGKTRSYRYSRIEPTSPSGSVKALAMYLTRPVLRIGFSYTCHRSWRRCRPAGSCALGWNGCSLVDRGAVWRPNRPTLAELPVRSSVC
jgi:hypothetical protein